MHTMSDEEWRAFVTREVHTGKFSYAGPDGAPRVTPVWYVFDGEDFLFTTGGDTVKARNLRRRPHAALCVDDERPPFSYVEARGEVTLSEDPDELLDVATRAGGRYMGEDRAEEFGRRNGVPGEVVVRLHPTKVVAYAELLD
ncbi:MULTISPECIES: PPOX class F420-dependent oxidoreductase [Streptomyces]|uniref:PPOX class F420-dependent enzyme n=1 Tax=Streptomyces cacaoi TaxID=1898 RepID=A0A4Y3R0R5_STRCI|nr:MULTISPECIES: PPOX class F420-dependent oxidoreductase [Streptomyces]NNG86033.1 PPOX class F420-dependent oxidoreductase [Streptomyces cacaoi]QHF98442.1 PPOX class F420-dependent oxidoreductase [Streptomyces sp. NHF165]GEB51234.1 PPOX class F420-dependent enzyme [Streptomyces cacaoi]